MKIAVLNVKYSPNLGDGVIAECLEMQLGKRLPGAEILSLDIGGRDDFGSGGSIIGTKFSLMDKVARLPWFMQQPIRSLLVPLAVRKKYAARWREPMQQADAIIIGGGQLLMDVELYFPYRIATAVLQSRRHTPLFVYGVGVSRSWSRRGLSLLNQTFAHARLTYAAVRDRQSQRYWSLNFAEDTPVLTRDPALLARQRYGEIPKAAAASGRKTIALGVSNPSDLRQHAEEPNAMAGASEVFYLELIERLARHGFDITLFTNGNDHGYLERVVARLDGLPAQVRPHVTVLPRALRPDELIAQVARADALIAHRLHANIIAYAYGIPHIGLAWDKKLQGFFESIGRQDYLVRSADSDANIVVEKLQKTLAEGIDTNTHARVIAETEAGINRLAEILDNAVLDQSPARQRQVAPPAAAG